MKIQLMFTDPTNQITTFLTNYESGCQVITSSYGVIAAYHKEDAQRILRQIDYIRLRPGEKLSIVFTIIIEQMIVLKLLILFFVILSYSIINNNRYN